MWNSGREREIIQVQYCGGQSHDGEYDGLLVQCGDALVDILKIAIQIDLEGSFAEGPISR